MQKIKITNADRFDSIPDNKTLIDVSYDIVEVDENGGETILESLRQSFPLTSSKADIEAELQKQLQSKAAESARAEEQAEIDAALEQADATIEELKGAEVLPTEEVTI